MNLVFKSLAGAVAACLAAVSVQAQDPAPRDVRDLIGARASSGESALKDRGYELYKSEKGSDRIWTNWWNQGAFTCITVVTLDGRYDSIVTVPTQDCGLSGPSPSHVGSASHGSDDRYGSGSGGEGVVLYHDYGFRGGHETVHGDISDMARTSIGNDSLSSIQVPRGCRVTLFADNNYRGRSVDLWEDESELGRTSVGNDSVSSMRVDCGGGHHGGSGGGDSVTLYHDYDFRGGSASVRHDISDMARSEIGNDALSSIRVPPGCRVTLYSDNNYRGRSVELYRDESELGRTAVGNDSVSSMRVSCN